MDTWNGCKYEVQIEDGNRFSSIRIFDRGEHGKMFPYDANLHEELLALLPPTGPDGDFNTKVDEWVEKHYLGKVGSKC